MNRITVARLNRMVNKNIRPGHRKIVFTLPNVNQPRPRFSGGAAAVGSEGGPLLDLPIPQQINRSGAESAGRSVDLLNAPIPQHEISKGDILKPSKPRPTPPPKLEKKIDKAVEAGKRKVEDWGKWLKDQVERESLNSAPRVVDDALKSFKDHINELYKNSDQYRFKLVEAMSSLRGFAKMYTIDGVGGFSPLDFLMAVKPTVVEFLLTQ